MSKSAPLRTSQKIFFSGAAFLGATGLILYSLPLLADYAHHQAKVVADLGASGQSDPLLAYQAAATLDPQQESYRVQLAKTYGEAWRPASALSALHPTDSTPEALLERSKALIELDRAGEATKLSHDSDDLAIQNALALALDGQKNRLESLKPLMNSQQGSVALDRIEADGTALAEVLAQRGMPQAALRVLDGAVDRSSAAAVLTAQLTLSKPDAGDADSQTAQSRLASAVNIDPADITVRGMLRQIYLKQNRKSEADAQEAEIRRLQSGKF